MIDDPLSEALSSLKPSRPPSRDPHDEIIERHSQRNNLDPNLVRALIGQESSGKPKAVSPKGARGLMQLMPGTAARFGVKNVFDPEENIRGGTDYLKFLNDEFGGDVDLMLAGYNAGEGAVKKFGNKIPPYRETQQYVPAVKARYQKLTGQSPDQDPLSSAIKTLKTSDPLSEAVSEIKPAETPQEAPKGRFAAMADATANPVRNVPRRAPVAQVEDSGFGPQFPKGTTTGIATSRNAKLVGRQRTPQVSRADVMRAEEAPVPGTGTYDNVDPRLAKGEQPSDPMAYAKAQELVGRVEPQREVGGIRAGATAMGPREQGIVERIGEAVDPYLRLDRPAGIKTDPLRGAASLGLLDLRRQITPEEKLIDPDAEAAAETAYQVGSFAPAVVPYVAAGKLASKIPALSAATREAHIARSALTFGGVELSREAARVAQTGEPLNPQEIAISTAIGGGIGGIAGVNPSLKKQIVAFITPGVVADVARGTDAETATFNALTNLAFGLHSYQKAPRDVQAAAKAALEGKRPTEPGLNKTREARYETETQPNVETQLEGVGIREAQIPPVVRPGEAGRVDTRAAESGVAQPPAVETSATPRHVDLQPRRQRGEGKGEFKKETAAQREERRAQVQPVNPESPPAELIPPQPSSASATEPATKHQSGAVRQAEAASLPRVEAKGRPATKQISGWHTTSTPEAAAAIRAKGFSRDKPQSQMEFPDPAEGVWIRTNKERMPLDAPGMRALAVEVSADIRPRRFETPQELYEFVDPLIGRTLGRVHISDVSAGDPLFIEANRQKVNAELERQGYNAIEFGEGFKGEAHEPGDVLVLDSSLVKPKSESPATPIEPKGQGRTEPLTPEIVYDMLVPNMDRMSDSDVLQLRAGLAERRQQLWADIDDPLRSRTQREQSQREFNELERVIDLANERYEKSGAMKEAVANLVEGRSVLGMTQADMPDVVWRNLNERHETNRFKAARPISTISERQAITQEASLLLSERGIGRGETLVNLMDNNQSGVIYDRIREGKASESEIQRFRQDAIRQGASPEFADEIIAAASEAIASRSAGISQEASQVPPRIVVPQTEGLQPRESTVDPLARLREQAQNIPRESPEVEFPSKVRQPRQPKSPVVGGKETRVSIPDSAEPLAARYEVREAADVYSSHDPVRFSPNPDYRYTNDRRYDQEKQYQAQVIDRAKNLDPAQLVNNSPTADLGPPIIDADGNALGGNSRTMMIKRAYRSADPKARDAYRKAVIDQASVYGVDPEQVAGMKQPVLVRVLSDASMERDVQKVISDLNRSSVTPLTREEQAISNAKQLSEDTARYLSEVIEESGDNATVASAMDKHGTAIINRLIEDGLIQPGKRNVLLRDGKPTAEAKLTVEQLLVGSTYRDLEQMNAAAPALRQNIERVVPSLKRVEGSEWDITEKVRNAIDAINESKTTRMELDKLNAQTSLLGKKQYAPDEIALAKVLQRGPRKTADAFRAYASDYSMEKSGGGLFGAVSKSESFAQHLEGKTPTAEEPSLIKAAREREAARAQEKQEGIEYRHAGADPYQLIDQLLIKGYELYQKGRPKFEEWAKRMRKEFGKDSEAHLADVYARLTASQSVNETLRKARSLPKTLEASGRQPGTELEYDVLPNPVATQTAAGRIARDGIQKAEEWYRTAEPSAERTEAFRQIGDQLLTQSVYEKDQAKAVELLTRGTELANIEAPRGTTLGQTIQAYSINNKFTPSGALLEATKIAERTKKELSKEDRDFVVRKAVEHQEADTNIKTLREQAELFEDVDRQHRSVEERIAQSGKDFKVIHGATRLLKDRDMGRGDFYREMKQRFGTSQREATNVFHEAYRLLRESRKAQEESNKKAKIRKANPTAGDKQLQEIYDHLQNELKRRREAKMELSKAFNRLERTNRSWWDRVVNLQRAAMVSRFSTAVRNAQTQFARGAGVEAITDAVETTIRGTFRLDNPLGYRDAWQHFENYLRLKGQRGRAESVLEEFPTEHEQVLGRYASDVDLPNVGPLSRGAETLLGKAEKGYAALNWANTLQEFTLRSAEFNTKLNQELKARGKPSLQEYLRRGQAEDIPIEAVRAAAKSAQEVTFAERPDRSTRLGRAADDLIQIGNSIPASVSPIGFPRYFYSSMKFLWDYNPSGFLTAGFSKNKPRSVAKALVGSAMLLTAYQVRKNDGGEKWYELYIPGTKQLVDMRPFGPFSLYLFIAEAVRRGLNDERGFTRREVADAAGIAITRGAAGTFESIYDILTNQSESVQAKAWKALKRTGGETVAAFLSPVQQAKDIIAQFDKSEGVRKDVGTAPFTGPIRENIPYASRGLTPAYLPTTDEPIHQEHPLAKLLTGYRVQTPKNFIQQELDRLKFSPQEVLTSSGVSEIDNRTKQLMGEIVEKQAEKLQHNRAYQNATDPRKALILREMLREARAAARERAEGENPDLARKLQRMRQSRREQEAGEPTEGSRRRFAAPRPQGAPPPP